MDKPWEVKRIVYILPDRILNIKKILTFLRQHAFENIVIDHVTKKGKNQIS